VELASCESNPGRSPAERAYATPFDGFTLDGVSTGGPDLFVVCKNCGSEVSPYITECPYCGQRLRKRAPKIDRDGRITERVSRRPTAATLVLVALGLVGCLIWRTSVISILNLVVIGNPGSQWWRVFTAPFVYDNTGYAFVALAIIAIYGTLMERRYGAVVVIALALIGGAGGLALAGHLSNAHLFLGGNGAALVLLTAWAVPDVMRLMRKHDFDGDLIGTGVLAAVIALMPLATTDASWVAAGVGTAAGLVLGFLLMRIHHT
jgi:membrane associated rhomboid family serine protease